MNRAQRRAQQKATPAYLRGTREQKVKALLKNGITPEDLEREYERGFKEGFKAAAPATFKAIYAAVCKALRKLYKFGRYRCSKVLMAVDDIVVYQDGGSLVVHKVIAVDGDTITTKGDANNVADDPISHADVKGRVLFWIPGIGSVIALIKSPVGTVCLIAAAIALVEIPHLRKKEQDDEERQKLIDEIRRLKDEL